ncbi:GDP-mannose 4,6-dehydratase [Mesorhizobium sp. CAU 1741]|uniref:GDP-mannose 4,6-dehydratase n=1 Tax=Mesorhizobium sp. CAU 1741 TaxID=3140366 RepID=UPI00325BC6CE
MARHRLLVTGAAGFVGRHLAEAARAHPLAGDIALAPLADGQGGTIDIRDAGAVDAAIEAFAPTAIIHLAAVASPREAAKEPDIAWVVNVMGTFNLANAAMRHAPGARFVFAGSSEVYGAGFAAAKGRPVSEDTLLEPMSPYGATKAAADIMLGQMARQGLAATRFRPFNHTGPGQTAAYVVSAFARQIVRIERGWQAPLMRVGNLAVRRDFLDARDVVRAYLAAALSDGAITGAFNLATGRPVAIAAMLETLRGLASVPVTVETDPALLREGEVETICGDPARAHAAFGWRAEIPLERTLADVLDHWRGLAETAPELVRD